MANTAELACVYASLILHDDNVDITADNIATLIKAANVAVDPYWPGLFAKLFEKTSIDDLLSNIGSGPAAGSGGGGGGGGGGGAAAVEEEEEKEEEKKEDEEEEDDDMGFSLFD